MGFTIESQLILFLAAILFSVIVGIEYDIFRISRLIFHLGLWAVFAEDLIFSLLCAVEFFFFCFLFNNGEIRLFVILTCIAAFAMYYMTIGKFIYKITKNTVVKIRKRGRGRDNNSAV